MWTEKYWAKEFWSDLYWGPSEEEEEAAGAVVGTEGAPSQNVIYYDAVRTTSKPKALEDIDGQDLADVFELFQLTGIITDKAA